MQQWNGRSISVQVQIPMLLRKQQETDDCNKVVQKKEVLSS